MKKNFFPILLASALFSSQAFANSGLDSSANTDLPLSAGGTHMITLCVGGSVCPPAYIGKILIGADPQNPTGWIDIATGNNSFVPAGAVMAFNLSACPTGWSVLRAAAGRTIFGAGNSGATGATTLSLSATGGEATHTLTVDEMPNHNHLFPGDDYIETIFGLTREITTKNGDWGSSYDADNNGWYNPGDLGKRGGDQPHNIMPPYLTLLYCQKD